MVRDRVIKPIGPDGKNATAVVVAAEKFTRADAPYPLDEAKMVF